MAFIEHACPAHDMTLKSEFVTITIWSNRSSTITHMCALSQQSHGHLLSAVLTAGGLAAHARVVLQKVLIAGFGQSTFMVELLRALDHELVPGSIVTLFSERTTKETVGAAFACCDGVRPHHTAQSVPTVLLCHAVHGACQSACLVLVVIAWRSTIQHDHVRRSGCRGTHHNSATTAAEGRSGQGCTPVKEAELMVSGGAGAISVDANLQRISMVQVQGNPCRRRDLRKLDITKYRCAIILCDQVRWSSLPPAFIVGSPALARP